MERKSFGDAIVIGGSMAGLLAARVLSDYFKTVTIVERDEPSHCYPYQQWLRSRGSHEPGLRERLTDLWVHYSLILLKFPVLFLNPFHPRLKRFPA